MRKPTLALALAGAVFTFAGYRSWHLRWGATDEEASAPMPGDDILGSAAFTATRAITVNASPEQVWPWLVQVGYHRAGFYSYDWADNLGHPSSRDVLPQFQSVVVGDLAAPMANPPNEHTAFRVALVDAPHSLVWSKPDSTWVWKLTPMEDGERTRLVTRLKAAYNWGPSLPVTIVLMEIGDFPMMRRMLLGIAERAAAHARRDLLTL